MKIKRNQNWMWGILMLLAAAVVILNQLGWFGEFNFWSMIAAVLAVILLVNCITNKTISTLPFVVAMVYIVLRNLEITPHVATWAILLAAVFVSVGLGLIFPQKPPEGKVIIGSFFGNDGNDSWCDEWHEGDENELRERALANIEGIDNNPSISVNFGHTSRYLHADNLETAMLSCNFGGMEIYFDQVQLSPNGATVYLDCKFGGIDIYVPRHWRVNEQINCSLGGVDINTRRAAPAADGPELTITGNVLCGGVDIWYV